MELEKFENLMVGDTVKLERNGTHYVEVMDELPYPLEDGLVMSYIGKDLETGRMVRLHDFDTLEKVEVEKEEEMEKHDVINKPNHYTNGKIEVIDYIEQVTSNYNPDIAFHIGNAIKYISRAPMKNGKEDIRKAKWYLDRAIEKWED